MGNSENKNNIRVPPEILQQRYDAVARQWVSGIKLKIIAKNIGVTEEEVHRYKRSKFCRKKIQELGGSFYRRTLGRPNKVIVAEERCQKASKLSHELQNQNQDLSNIDTIRSIAKQLNVDVATIYSYIRRDDWTGVKDLSKKNNDRSLIRKLL